MLRQLAGALALCFLGTQSQAALLGRLPLTPGGTDYQAYYDTSLNMTWVADANLVQTSGYDADGLMTWTEAQAWIASLNAQNGGLGYLGMNYWRLPAITDTGTPGCNFAYTGTDCGYNVNLATGAMARLYYSTLGNVAYYNSSGVPTGCSGPTLCLTNKGPFSNLQAFDYWSGTEYAPDTTRAWVFFFQDGRQDYGSKISHFYAWAVLDGDVDSDGDGVQDFQDNCTQVANNDPGTVPHTAAIPRSQFDADGDGYGNACDPDINQSGGTTTSDYTLLRNVLSHFDDETAATCSGTCVPGNIIKADLNGSGQVTTADYTILRNRLNTAPGPSGLCAAAPVMPCTSP